MPLACEPSSNGLPAADRLTRWIESTWLPPLPGNLCPRLPFTEGAWRVDHAAVRPESPTTICLKQVVDAMSFSVAPRLAAIALLSASSTAFLQAADWPQWQGPNRDAVSAETGLLTEWPEAGPALTWRIEGLGGRIDWMADNPQRHRLTCAVSRDGEKRPAGLNFPPAAATFVLYDDV